MSTLLPRGEKLRRALRWISQQRQEPPERPLGPLLNEATLRFDLTPKESEFLISFYREVREREAGRSEGSDPKR
jgi:hypothetical protein